MYLHLAVILTQQDTIWYVVQNSCMNPYRTDSPAVHAHNHLELTLALIGSHRDPNLKVTVLGVTLIWSNSALFRTDPNPNLNSLLS